MQATKMIYFIPFAVFANSSKGKRNFFFMVPLKSLIWWINSTATKFLACFINRNGDACEHTKRKVWNKTMKKILKEEKDLLMNQIHTNSIFFFFTFFSLSRTYYFFLVQVYYATLKMTTFQQSKLITNTLHSFS